MANPNSHNFLDQLLHDFYLGNQALAELSFDIENLSSGSIQKPKENLFITGLARSGTTSVFNNLYDTGEFGSLLYSDMPFLLMPNLWGKFAKKKSAEKSERFHGDNILVGNNSPEALDEFFWKVFLKNSYISKESLNINDISDEILRKYEKYISLICQARNKQKYISKNNNSILRLPYLKNLSSPTKIILLYRNPFDQASSLLNLHLKFSELQKNNKFILRYFDYLGHHEFGLHQKPFALNTKSEIEVIPENKESMDFWIRSWINYYSYIIEHFSNDIILISFEDICQHPEKTYSYLNDKLGLNFINKLPSTYKAPSYNTNFDLPTVLRDASFEIYNTLNKKRQYI